MKGGFQTRVNGPRMRKMSAAALRGSKSALEQMLRCMATREARDRQGLLTSRGLIGHWRIKNLAVARAIGRKTRLGRA